MLLMLGLYGHFVVCFGILVTVDVNRDEIPSGLLHRKITLTVVVPIVMLPYINQSNTSCSQLWYN